MFLCKADTSTWCVTGGSLCQPNIKALSVLEDYCMCALPTCQFMTEAEPAKGNKTSLLDVAIRFKCIPNIREKMRNVTKNKKPLRPEFMYEASVGERSESCLVKHQTDDWREIEMS